MSSREYTKEWITGVRGSMSKVEFGKHIYVFKKNGTVCTTVHRNTIKNWESGKTVLPRDVETFLSFVLMEYDKENGEYLDCPEARNRRYHYARKAMKEMLGVDLYCRNLHDALLIQVCRGILTFEKLPALENELETKLSKVTLDADKKNEYAMERNTVTISKDLEKVKDEEELIRIVTIDYRNSFASANRIIGARMDNIYRKNNRYCKTVPLGKAVANLAPNYKESYIRMYKSSNISRRWMIDLCRHLRFSKIELDAVLEAAHMSALDSNEKFPDFINELYEKELQEKLLILFLTGCGCVSEMIQKKQSLPQVEYVLESFTYPDRGQRLLEDAREILKNGAAEWEYARIRRVMETSSEKWIEYVTSQNLLYDYDQDLQAFLKAEWQAYYAIDIRKVRLVRVSRELENLHYLAALCYTIFCGKKFEGTLAEADLKIMKRAFADEKKDIALIYNFLSQMMGVFLDDQELRIIPDEGYYVYNKKTKKITRPMRFETILKDLWESIISLQ